MWAHTWGWRAAAAVLTAAGTMTLAACGGSGSSGEAGKNGAGPSAGGGTPITECPDPAVMTARLGLQIPLEVDSATPSSEEEVLACGYKYKGGTGVSATVRIGVLDLGSDEFARTNYDAVYKLHSDCNETKCEGTDSRNFFEGDETSYAAFSASTITGPNGTAEGSATFAGAIRSRFVCGIGFGQVDPDTTLIENLGRQGRPLANEVCDGAIGASAAAPPVTTTSPAPAERRSREGQEYPGTAAELSLLDRALQVEDFDGVSVPDDLNIEKYTTSQVYGPEQLGPVRPQLKSSVVGVAWPSDPGYQSHGVIQLTDSDSAQTLSQDIWQENETTKEYPAPDIPGARLGYSDKLFGLTMVWVDGSYVHFFYETGLLEKDVTEEVLTPVRTLNENWYRRVHGR